MERQSTEPEDEILETGEKVTYWYKTFIQYCPVCGREAFKETKERQYSPKPEDPSERTSIKEIYDYCNSL